MTNLATENTSKEIAAITEENVMTLLFGDKEVKPTQTEVLLFIELCKSQGLNPWLREVHLIKYAANQPASVVVGKDAFMQRANLIPTFDGMSAGVIVQRDKSIEYIEGSFAIAGVDVLLGGWAKVFHKDKTVPTYQAVSLKEYHSGQSTWLKMPLTMIRKVAMVQTLREAFPHHFTGMYDASEMQQAVVGADIVSETGQTVTPETVTIPANIQIPDVVIEEETRECPVHEGQLFERFQWANGPVRYRHSDGVHPADADKRFAGKNKWCYEDCKEVLAALSQAKSQPKGEPSLEKQLEDRRDEQAKAMEQEVEQATNVIEATQVIDMDYDKPEPMQPPMELN